MQSVHQPQNQQSSAVISHDLTDDWAQKSSHDERWSPDVKLLFRVLSLLTRTTTTTSVPILQLQQDLHHYSKGWNYS
jgi:hypothetical protein